MGHLCGAGDQAEGTNTHRVGRRSAYNYSLPWCVFVHEDMVWNTVTKHSQCAHFLNRVIQPLRRGGGGGNGSKHQPHPPPQLDSLWEVFLKPFPAVPLLLAAVIRQSNPINLPEGGGTPL